MSASSPQRNGHHRRSRPAVLVAAVLTVVVLLSLAAPPADAPPGPADPGSGIGSGVGVEGTPAVAGTPTAATPNDTDPGPTPPNLADPRTPLPEGLTEGEPVRLIVDGAAPEALDDMTRRRDGVAVVTTSADSLATTVEQLRRSGATRVELDAVVAPHTTVTPTDPFWSQWWGARQFSLPAAWGSALGNPDTVIAVIDSGVSEVAELAGRVLPGTTYLGGTADPRVDLDGHGTSSAIVAAGAINNGVAAGGSCPQCRVLPVQVVDPETGLAYLSDVAAGIRWATDNGADVISISLGGTSTISALASAVTYANSRGVPVIASAGNDGNEVVNYPAGLTNVIGVAALGDTGELASWSTRGTWVTTAVAGCNITQRSSDGAAIWFCGTSSAAPLLAGAVALLDSRFPDSSVAALTERVVTASSPGVLTAHGSASAAAIVTPTAPPGVIAPGVPTIASVEPGPRQLTVTVTAPTADGGSPISRYELSLDGGAFTPVSVEDPTTPTVSFTVGGLANGTAYRLRVRAVNVAGSGPASAEVPGTPRTVPAAVGVVAGETAGSSAVRFAWALPDTGGAPLSAVELQWGGTTDLEGSGTIVDLGPTATTGLVDGLEAATTVYARVRAVNAAGPGPWSPVASATSDADGGSNVVNPPGPTPVPLAPTPFEDVPLGSWFDTATRWAFTVGVTNGVGPTSFGSGNPITRAQWLAMLWRLEGRPTPSAPTPFSDVPSGAYYAAATAWAAEVGISEGVDGTSAFQPNRAITRAEVVTMLWRLEGRPQPTSTASFGDVPQGRYYTLAVAWAKETGVTTGVGTTGRFQPSGQSSRAEAVTLLWRQVGSPASLPPA